MRSPLPGRQAPSPRNPAWARLYDVAASQSGLFTLEQAEASGYSSQHLQKHLRAGRILRVRRGIYRLTQFPAGEHEELVALWLWSGRAGVFSHETSLFLHDLSDVLPARVHLTVPEAWRARRLRLPEGLVLHFAGLGAAEISWVGTIPVTAAHQAIAECVTANTNPELTGQAVRDARRRGLISQTESRSLTRRLRTQEGGPP